jgi:hypothetical protein
MKDFIRTSLALLGGLALMAALSATADASGGRVITFEHPHAVHSMKQADKYLKGTPRGFRRFAARLGRKYLQPGPCPHARGVEFTKYDTEGYAFGFPGVCSAPETIWARLHGKWRDVAGTQERYFGCRDLRRAKVPSALAGTHCLTSGGRTRAYHQS